MKITSLLISLLFLVFYSSYSEKEIILERTWVFKSYDSKSQTFSYYQRSKFSKSKPGIQFIKEGKLKVKQSTGNCGTIFPGEKIDYEIVDGTWEKLTDSIIVLKHPLWDKNYTEKFKIVELTKNKLVTRILP
ncbi:hypothetical protein HYN48_13830 [Flavobacterium magnum]|uniref:Lipocalin-like domain-containing protein n=1 Tax=Flavobacterium magnum TaxID=2162713 RepID=A0A2S0RIM5_9FLAO|nr:hypothetical protein [Flavobacterium magnum]AWA31078.1 hypothetical protein HYN48_13830 [Flavobacterium magnum]